MTTTTTDPTSTIAGEAQRVNRVISGYAQGSGLGQGLGQGSGFTMIPPHVVTIVTYDWGYVMHLGAQVGHLVNTLSIPCQFTITQSTSNPLCNPLSDPLSTPYQYLVNLLSRSQQVTLCLTLCFTHSDVFLLSWNSNFLRFSLHYPTPPHPTSPPYHNTTLYYNGTLDILSLSGLMD